METLQQWFNLVDVIAGIVLLAGLIAGVRRGFSGEIIRLVIVAASVFVGWTFAPMVVDRFPDADLSPQELFLAGFLVLSICSYLLLNVIRAMIAGLMEFSFRGKFEIYGGAVLGLIRSALVVIALIMVLHHAPSEGVRIKVDESFTGAHVIQLATPWLEKLEDEFPQLRFPESREELEDMVDPMMHDAVEPLGPISGEP